ncbi:MAG: 6-phosphogluconolactonase, partial [Bacteroidota bacterium]
MELHIHIYDNNEGVAAAFAEWLKDWFANQPENPVHIALSGGSTPKLLFQKLADSYADSFDWGRIHFWWGDERCVPPDHAESNYRMTKEIMLDKLTLPEENVHRVLGEAQDLELERKRYADEMRKWVPMTEDLPRFDLIMLGMGDDGHTASIFPNQMALLEDEDWVAVATHPVSGQRRLTFTGPLLNHAAVVAFLVTGTKKAGKVAQIIGGRPGGRALPAYHVAPSDGVLHWYLDR